MRRADPATLAPKATAVVALKVMSCKPCGRAVGSCPTAQTALRPDAEIHAVSVPAWAKQAIQASIRSVIKGVPSNSRSDRDIAIRAVAEGKGPSTKVREIMSAGVWWAYDDDTVEHAAKLMSEHQVRRLPVVDRDKRLVGIVALGDFAVDKSDIKPAAEALSKISEPPPS